MEVTIYFEDYEIGSRSSDSRFSTGTVKSFWLQTASTSSRGDQHIEG